MTSSPLPDPRVMGPLPTADRVTINGVVYERSAVLAARLEQRLAICVRHIEAAHDRANRTDTTIAWTWAAAWCLLGRQVELDLRIAIGELPAADAEVLS